MSVFRNCPRVNTFFACAILQLFSELISQISPLFFVIRENIGMVPYSQLIDFA